MSDPRGLAEQFEERRDHLRAVAYRMLGSTSEADDAVQEAWLKLSRADTHAIHSFGGWLTTVVARVCLDMLRARSSRREEELPRVEEAAGVAFAPADHALAESIGPALLVVLDVLTPAERVAFVLHDVFDLHFEDIAPILGRTPAAARQLASRARRRVRGAPTPGDEVETHHAVVIAFLAASREGDFRGLLEVLAPEAVLRADDVAVRAAAERSQAGAPRLAPSVRGAPLVADVFLGRARGAVPARIDGEPGAAWVMAGQVRAAFVFSCESGKIAAIDLVMDPADLAELRVEIE